MAQSRLERIGTIYSRATGLMKSGAVSWDDRPLWYDVYEAFPPTEESRYDRPAPKIPLRKIFYEEDKIRALFHKSNKRIGAVGLTDTKHQSLTQKFINNYRKIEAQYAGNSTQEQIYQEAIDLLRRDREVRKDDQDVNIGSSFKALRDNKDTANIKINVSEIFKE